MPAMDEGRETRDDGTHGREDEKMKAGTMDDRNSRLSLRGAAFCVPSLLLSDVVVSPVRGKSRLSREIEGPQVPVSRLSHGECSVSS